MTEKRRTGRPPSCTCGECAKCKRAAYMRQWWNRWTPEQKREKVAQRNPELVREQDRRKMEKRRIKARAEVRLAIARGDLTRQGCEEPDCDEIGHAHHEDYERPLDVRWLCRSHHDALHGFGAREAA